MKKLKKILLSPAVTIIAFVLAAGLLLFSTIGGARAALTYFSETYASRVQMYDIGVSLLENGTDAEKDRVSWRDYNSRQADGTWSENTGVLVANMLAEGEKLVLGKAYTEELYAANTGTINEYVRVTVYKYWVDDDGNKLLDLDPAYINLNLVNLDTDWILDSDATTTERTVLYFNRLLNSGEVTPMFTDTLTINGNVAAKAHQTTLPNGNIQTVYEYDGARFCIEARVDAVQENNAEDAVLSAWGKNVVVDPDAGTLNLR